MVKDVQIMSGNPLLQLTGYHITDRIVHHMAFVIPVVEHLMKREIAPHDCIDIMQVYSTISIKAFPHMGIQSPKKGSST